MLIIQLKKKKRIHRMAKLKRLVNSATWLICFYFAISWGHFPLGHPSSSTWFRCLWTNTQVAATSLTADRQPLQTHGQFDLQYPTASGFHIQRAQKCTVKTLLLKEWIRKKVLTTKLLLTFSKMRFSFSAIASPFLFFTRFFSSFLQAYILPVARTWQAQTWKTSSEETRSNTQTFTWKTPWNPKSN